jgi:hypothetical protein
MSLIRRDEEINDTAPPNLGRMANHCPVFEVTIRLGAALPVWYVHVFNEIHIVASPLVNFKLKKI